MVWVVWEWSEWFMNVDSSNYQSISVFWKITLLEKNRHCKNFDRIPTWSKHMKCSHLIESQGLSIESLWLDLHQNWVMVASSWNPIGLWSATPAHHFTSSASKTMVDWMGIWSWCCSAYIWIAILDPISTLSWNKTQIVSEPLPCASTSSQCHGLLCWAQLWISMAFHAR